MKSRSQRTTWVLLGAALLGLVAAGSHMAWKNRQARIAREAAEAQQRIADEERRAREAAARVFGASQPATELDRATFDPLFTSLGSALQGQKPADVVTHFDPEHMAGELESHGFFTHFGPADAQKKAREDFLSDFERVGRLVAEDPLYRWNRTTIRRVSRNSDGSAALVVATHTLDGRREPLRMRWWLIATPLGWKVYDLENLIGGVRLTALLEADTNADGRSKYEQFSVKVRDALGAAMSGNFEIADQLLALVRNQKLPNSLSARVALTEALIRIHRGEPVGARPFLEQAEKLDPELPTLKVAWAIARARTGDLPGAIDAAGAYAEKYGDDLGIRFWHGFAAEQLGQLDEAARFYGLALDDDPNLLIALIGLQRTTKQPEELAARLARTRQPGVAFDLLQEAAETQRIPFHLEPPTADEAVRAFAEALRYQRVEALYANKQGLQAYQKVGPVERTFDQLARNYARNQDVSGLARLLVVHADSFPNDPWLEFWQGKIASLQGEHLKAAVRFRLFRRSAAASPAARYQAAVLQVRSLIRAGDTAEAISAENEIGPEWLPLSVRAAVFALADDAVGLERILAAQAKNPQRLLAIYADEDFAKLFADQQYAPLRAKYPAPQK